MHDRSREVGCRKHWHQYERRNVEPNWLGFLNFPSLLLFPFCCLRFSRSTLGQSRVVGTPIGMTIRRPIGFAETEVAVTPRSVGFGVSESERILRSTGFKRSGSSNKMVSGAGPNDAVMERSLSFKNWQPEAAEIDAAADGVTPQPPSLKIPVKFVAPQLELPRDRLAEFSSPRPLSELDAAAITLQKVYKGYRTRRNLADCAVVVEELWWKALDFASLERSSVSFFNVEKPEPAVSKWARAKKRVARVGKGLSKDDKAQKLALQHWLEAIDPRHRYGHNLHLYYDIWFATESSQPFFYWLDVGDGREVNLDECSRSKLNKQCITYLGPKERETYEVIVENGKLVYKKSEVPVNTTEGSKWIFVLSTSRSLYVGQKNKGTFQHSSFLAGGATTAAGRLVAEEGTLKAIWPYSGHYLPTEDNFKEFISFLEDNSVDLTNVKRCSVDDDEYPSNRKSLAELAAVVAEVVERARSDEAREPETAARLEQEENTSKGGADKEPSFQLGRRLSCKWSSGIGARIGCVRDYPADLLSKALEQVNLSPRVALSPITNRTPIPSPRPSPKMRLSPRLQYMGIPTPTVSLTLPKPKR